MTLVLIVGDELLPQLLGSGSQTALSHQCHDPLLLLFAERWVLPTPTRSATRQP